MSSDGSSPELQRDCGASDAGLVQAPPPSSRKSDNLGNSLMIDRNLGPQKSLPQIVSAIDQADDVERYDLEEKDNNVPSANSIVSSVSLTREIISWKDGDPENPYNWSTTKKVKVVAVGILVVVNSTMGSSLPSNAIPIISEYFHITSPSAQILPISMYLFGYVLGPFLFGPLSEAYGRRSIMIGSFFFYTIFTMACALAPNFPALLIFRILVGINASSPISVTGGIYADIYDDPVTRGRAMAMFMGGTCVGPMTAPLISGFIAPALSWRWVFWVGLIVAGASWVPLLWLPETNGPVLLSRRASCLRKTTQNPNILAPFDLEKKGWKQMAIVTLTRPLRMVIFELIVSATCIYLSLIYGIFYMYFEAYPIVFEGIYNQTPGISGLMFLPIGGGAILSIFVFLWYDGFLRRAQAQHKSWTEKEESRRLPLAFIGGPLLGLGLFWLGWTSRPSIPFYVPMLAGIPFGTGFVLIFMALLNYLTDAYEIFAASAMAAASGSRSVAGAVLPFSAKPMYNKLGVPWASSLLGFLSLVMCIIPWIFLWQGQRLRDGSRFYIFLKEKKIKELEELEKQRTRQRTRPRALIEGIFRVGSMEENF